MTSVANHTAPPRPDITSTWGDCYTSLSTTARRYVSQSGKKNFSRRVQYASDLVAYNEEAENSHVLEELVGVMWQVYKVSPLWNVKMVEDKKKTNMSSACQGGENDNIRRMVEGVEGWQQSYDVMAIKGLARVLQQYVATHALSSTDNPYKVDMVVVKGLRGAQSDGEALKVTVSTVMDRATTRQVLIGFLCGVETAELQLKSPNVTNLPVLLLSGPVDTRERVVFGLEKCFDCVISPLKLPERELQWMSAMWAGLEVNTEPENNGNMKPRKGRGKKRVPLQDKSNNEEVGGTEDEQTNKTIEEPVDSLAKKVMKLTFVTPLSLGPEIREKIKHMTLEFPAGEVRQIWQALHREGDYEFSEEEMEAFHSSIRVHVRETLGLEIDKLELFQISLPFFKATQSGMVRMEASDHVKVVLRYLTEICQGEMLEVAPTLGHCVQTDDDSMDWNVTTGVQ